MLEPKGVFVERVLKPARARRRLLDQRSIMPTKSIAVPDAIYDSNVPPKKAVAADTWASLCSGPRRLSAVD
jgi:hypothetical protein